MKKYIITLLVVIACVVFSTALVANAAPDVNGVKSNNSVSQSQSTKSDVDGLKDAFDAARADNNDLSVATEFAKSDVDGLKDAFDAARVTNEDLEEATKYTTSAEFIAESIVTTESQLSNIHTLQVVQLLVSSVTCVVISGLEIIFIMNMRGNKGKFKN